MNSDVVNSLPVLAAGVMHPVAVLSLCVLAGVGTVLVLPGRREASYRKIGGVVLLAAGLIFAAMVLRFAGAFSFGEMYFWAFSAIAVLAAVRVISHSKLVYSALYFVLTVLASAGLFILLWAEFMAAALVLIYAGAILITYVFVIMLASQAQTASPGTAEAQGAEYDRVSRDPAIASAVGFALMGMIIFLIFEKAPVAPMRAAAPAAGAAAQVDGTVQELGLYLFSHQIVPLELAGLLLTIAMVGAVIIARRQMRDGGGEPGERVDLAGSPGEDNPHTIPIYGTRNPRQKAFPEG